MKVKWKYHEGDLLSVDLLMLTTMVYTPMVYPQAWLMWFAAMGQSFLIGRRLR